MLPEIRTVPAGTAKTSNKGRYDYRMGVEYATSVPRAYQPRKGGPPLLFATDVRMTILVHLALAPSPVRPAWLWRHIGRRSHLALYPLIERGLITSWKVNGATFIALDPCHPAAYELGVLLLVVGRLYGFEAMQYDGGAGIRSTTPTRSSRRRDVRYTFGDRTRTMTLLLVYILGEAISTDIERCVPRLERGMVRDTLNMYCAFGLLKKRRVVRSKRRAHGFSFDDAHPLVPYIKDVLKALDERMPQWRAVAERQRTSQPPLRFDRQDGRRKIGRWKW